MKPYVMAQTTVQQRGAKAEMVELNGRQAMKAGGISRQDEGGGGG